jgi:ribulose-5-phosphate 4-epimerase/fuculose-1-phosphate aldolase
MERLELQKDLVAAFRWPARLNKNEAVSTHFSVCLPNSNDSFYVNKAGIHFSRVKVSDLVLVERSNLEKIKKDPSLVDPTAINIHGEIHKRVPQAKCILHVHSKYATVLSTLKNPELPPIDQNTMRFYNRVSVLDNFGGLGFEEESKKMATCLGNKQLMLLANHGVLVTGQTVAQAFDDLYYFERACRTYIIALSTNKELKIASSEVAEKTAQECANYPIDLAGKHLKEIRSILDKEEPDYKN